MGMLAQYLQVDDETLERLTRLENEALIDNIEDLSDLPGAQVLDIDKLWDGLHFLLTGVSATESPAGNKLSEAMTGVHVFNPDDPDADFISYTNNEELPMLIDALRQVDLNMLEKKRFKLNEFRARGIYPDIWHDSDRIALFCELSEAYQALVNFSEQALDAGMHVVFSVY